MLVEHDPEIEKSTGLQVEDALLKPTPEGFAQLLVTNPSGYSQSAVRGIVLGEAVEATVIQPEETHLSAQAYAVTVEGSHGTVAREDCAEGTSALKERRQKLLNLLGEHDLPAPEKTALQKSLTDHCQAFCIEDGERGETDLIPMKIDTGDSHPVKQPVWRMPLEVRQEVARQLGTMQSSGVIQASKSPWASPVVLVRKRDGSITES